MQHSELHEYRGYTITITEQLAPWRAEIHPLWRAQIDPRLSGMETPFLETVGVHTALVEAKALIDRALSSSN